MKKLIILLLVAFTGQLIGQKQIVWFDVGAKAQWGATALYNKALWDSKIYDVNITTGYSYGGKFGMNFGFNGVAVDVMFSNGNQEFGDKNNVTLGNINYKTTDVYILYRNAKNLGYFELGPKLSFLNSIDMTPTGGEAVDLKAYNEKNNIAAVIGFGANIMGTDGRFSGILGLRFEYGLKNMNNADAIAVGSPVFDQGLLYADGESSTNPVFAGVVFELNWGVGYFGKAQCGGRSKFIMF